MRENTVDTGQRTVALVHALLDERLEAEQCSRSARHTLQR